MTLSRQNSEYSDPGWSSHTEELSSDGLPSVESVNMNPSNFSAKELSIRQGVLCDSCQKMLDDVKLTHLLTERSVDVEPVIISRGLYTLRPKECQICAILKFHLGNDRFYQQWCIESGVAVVDSQVQVVSELIRRYINSFSSESIEYCIFNRFEPSQIKPRFHMRCQKYTSSDSSMINKQHLSSEIDCLFTWELASKWIKQCVNGHKTCNVKPDDHWLPTRLLDVGIAENDQASLRLIKTDMGFTTGSNQYMTLSHCWGDIDTIKLTQKNITELHEEISLSNLPNLFRDAIRVARRVGIQYLWIDKLCIVQDSPEDWQHEAALMEKVYQNSFCNIAALDCHNDTEHFLCDRNLMSTGPFSIEICISDDQTDTFILFEPPILENNPVLEKHPLLERAWCFQERLLAPRSLNFTSRQITWECRTNDAYETFPTEYVSFTYPKILQRLKVFLTAPEHMEWGTSERDYSDQFTTPIAVWSRIFLEYSRRNLSHPSDKLYALSGISRASKKYLGEFAAGLWKDYIWIELLWQVNTLTGWGSSFRPAVYRAPTWSWASLDGRIWCPHHERTRDSFQALSTLVDLSVTTIDGDEFTQITSAYVCIKGRLKPGRWKMFEASIKNPFRNGKRKMELELYIDESQCVEGNPSSGLTLDEEDSGQNPAPSDVILLPLIQDLEHKHNELQIHGLVVCPFENDTFRRLGTFSVDAKKFEKIFQQCAEEVIKIV